MIINPLTGIYEALTYGSDWVDYNHGLPKIGYMCYIIIKNGDTYTFPREVYHPIPFGPQRGFLSSEGWKDFNGQPIMLPYIVTQWKYDETSQARCEIL